jgi:hypothetical protein
MLGFRRRRKTAGWRLGLGCGVQGGGAALNSPGNRLGVQAKATLRARGGGGSDSRPSPTGIQRGGGDDGRASTVSDRGRGSGGGTAGDGGPAGGGRWARRWAAARATAGCDAAAARAGPLRRAAGLDRIRVDWLGNKKVWTFWKGFKQIEFKL